MAVVTIWFILWRLHFRIYFKEPIQGEFHIQWKLFVLLQVNAVNVNCANKGLVPHGQQGITRTKEDPIHFRVYASLGFSVWELSHSMHMYWLKRYFLFWICCSFCSSHDTKITILEFHKLNGPQRQLWSYDIYYPQRRHRVYIYIYPCVIYRTSPISYEWYGFNDLLYFTLPSCGNGIMYDLTVWLMIMASCR